jgi:hypothetical protein
MVDDCGDANAACAARSRKCSEAEDVSIVVAGHQDEGQADGRRHYRSRFCSSRAPAADATLNDVIADAAEVEERLEVCRARHARLVGWTKGETKS